MPSAARLVALRMTLLAAAAVLVAHVRLTGRPSTVCLLRATTGIPCPLCGGTTAAVQLGRGDVAAALRASPLAVLGGPVVAALPVLRGRLARLPRGSGLSAAVVVLAAAEVWQLARFGLL